MVSASQLQLEQTPAEPGRRPVEAPNRSIPVEAQWHIFSKSDNFQIKAGLDTMFDFFQL